MKLYDATRDKRFLDIAELSARFALHDIKETALGKNVVASSYTPFDNSQVVNASAYRAFMLAGAYKRFGGEAYQDAAKKNINFVLSVQQDNGSWL